MVSATPRAVWHRPPRPSASPRFPAEAAPAPLRFWEDWLPAPGSVPVDVAVTPLAAAGAGMPAAAEETALLLDGLALSAFAEALAACVDAAAPAAAPSPKARGGCLALPNRWPCGGGWRPPGFRGAAPPPRSGAPFGPNGRIWAGSGDGGGRRTFPHDRTGQRPHTPPAGGILAAGAALAAAARRHAAARHRCCVRGSAGEGALLPKRWPMPSPAGRGCFCAAPPPRRDRPLPEGEPAGLCLALLPAAPPPAARALLLQGRRGAPFWRLLGTRAADDGRSWLAAAGAARVGEGRRQPRRGQQDCPRQRDAGAAGACRGP